VAPDQQVLLHGSMFWKVPASDLCGGWSVRHAPGAGESMPPVVGADG
jgi:hypothetical protein